MSRLISISYSILITFSILSCKPQPIADTYQASSYYEEDSLKFNAHQWQALYSPVAHVEHERHYMLKDLLENHLIIGMDSSAIKELLGEPEKRYVDHNGFTYHLGLYISGLDPTFLNLDFDPQGKLSKIEINTI